VIFRVPIPRPGTASTKYDAMKPLRLLLLALLLGGTRPTPARAQDPVRPPPATGGVEGEISGRQGSISYPLPHVLLEFSRGLDSRSAATDESGRYRVRGLAPGRWRVHAIHVGHEGLSMEVLVPAGGLVELDVELMAHPIRLDPLTVRALPIPTPPTGDEAPPRDLGEIALRAMEGSTGVVESGLAQVARSLPGSNEAEPTDVLLMRGSSADLKLVLLDGAPVYTPFHLGGLVESFDPRALGGASLFLGGAPARFDGGLSYIMDLRTRRPREDRYRGRMAADLLTSRVLLEGPALGGGVMAGGRLIHDLGTPALDRGGSPYGYHDLLLRGNWGEEHGSGASVTGFWNQETVRLHLGDLGPRAEGAAWGNQAISGGIHGTIGQAFGEIRGAVSRYDARLPVADSIPLYARSQSDRVRITGDLSYPWNGGVIRVGAVLDRMDSRYHATGLDGEGTPVESGLVLDGTTLGFYGEGTREVGRSLELRGGIRLDNFSGRDGLQVAPRASLSWLLTDNAVLTLAAGRYHQFSALSSGQVEESLADNAAAPEGFDPVSVGSVTVGTADHLVVSLDQILLPGLRLGVEGYMKRFSGVFHALDQDLNASGVDLRVARDGDRASGWVGYTLTWFWASEDGILGGDSRFSGRHLLSAGLTTRISEGTGLRLRVGYGDGIPYTSVPISASPDPSYDSSTGGGAENRFELDGDNLLNQAPNLAVGPDQGFLRVEGEVFAEWITGLGGVPLTVRPYLRVLNALNRRDALFYHFEPWRDSNPRPLTDLPLLPLLGVEIDF